MSEWIIQLGREDELCYEELRQVAERHSSCVERLGENVARLARQGDPFSIQDFCDGLGGAIRAICPVGQFSEESEGQFLSGPAFQPIGPWAVSALSGGLSQEREMIRNWTRQRIGEDSEAHGREVRAAPGDSEVVPARISEKGLAGWEGEICLWREGSGEIGIGKTCWVFPAVEYQARDIGKPKRPQRRGLIPPKLARIMINLARKNETSTVLDPFCGSGGVLIEGLTLGLKMRGSDSRAAAIKQSRENLEWYLSEDESKQAEMPTLQQIDVRQLSKHIDPLSIDSVAGEGDLGPPIRGKLARKSVIDLLPQIQDLYIKAFAEIRIVLKPGGRVCLAGPFWQPNEGDPIFLNIARHLALIGYRPVLESRGFEPLIYRRKDQRVGRAIYLLESPM